MTTIVCKRIWLLESLCTCIFSLWCELPVWLPNSRRRQMRLDLCDWLFTADWLHMRS